MKMLLAVINDVIDREEIRDEIETLDKLFYGLLKTEEAQELRVKMKEALQNGGEDDAKKYLALLYMAKKNKEAKR